VERAVRFALRDARLEPQFVGHISAHGLSTQDEDRGEAAAIHKLLGDTPVTAVKSYTGNLCAAAGAVETVVALLALEHRQIPVTLNYESPDPACPIRLVHDEPLEVHQPTALVINQTTMGQAAAVVISAE
jgi:3-oxoacyl-[acyl-carrier-protein] synthase II